MLTDQLHEMLVLPTGRSFFHRLQLRGLDMFDVRHQESHKLVFVKFFVIIGELIQSYPRVQRQFAAFQRAVCMELIQPLTNVWQTCVIGCSAAGIVGTRHFVKVSHVHSPSGHLSSASLQHDSADDGQFDGQHIFRNTDDDEAATIER
jgi:hypothetical protein